MPPADPVVIAPHPADRPPRRRAWWLVASAGGALAALHFTLLAAWLLPVSAAPWLQHAAQAYVAPVFAQNWWLFAPDPAGVDRRVEVRGAWFEAGVRRETAWLPLIQPLAAAVQANPLTPQNATWIMVLNATYALSDPGGVLRLRGGARDLVLRGWSNPALQPAPLVVLERVGSTALAAAHPGLRLAQVQVRLTVRPLPAFARRDSAPDLAAEELLFPPVPISDELVATSAAP